MAALLFQLGFNLVNFLLFVGQGFLKLGYTLFQVGDLGQGLVTLAGGSLDGGVCFLPDSFNGGVFLVLKRLLFSVVLGPVNTNFVKIIG
ncbi:MAG: hypothetical protein AB2660_06705 [Candidatus Thiodiazotropha sp.]